MQSRFKPHLEIMPVLSYKANQSYIAYRVLKCVLHSLIFYALYLSFLALLNDMN